MFSEFLTDFMEYCSIEKKLDEKTQVAYKTDLLQCMGIIGDRQLIKITKDDIRCYIKSISGFKYNTIKRKLASLNAMLNYFEMENEWYVNPLRKMNIHMRQPIRYPIVMTIDEVRVFIELTNQNVQHFPVGSFSYIMAKRNIAIIELLFATGMRVSELCNLQYKDVDVWGGRVRIIGKGNKERIVDICQEKTIQVLKDWLVYRDNNQEDAPFFYSRLRTKLSPQSVRLLIARLASICGIKKHVTPHTFRHTFATLLLEEDVDLIYIQQLLGHSSILTTQIYTHVNHHKQREILQTKHPRRKI